MIAFAFRLGLFLGAGLFITFGFFADDKPASWQNASTGARVFCSVVLTVGFAIAGAVILAIIAAAVVFLFTGAIR